jgi:hypothetical protein
VCSSDLCVGYFLNIIFPFRNRFYFIFFKLNMIISLLLLYYFLYQTSQAPVKLNIELNLFELISTIFVMFSIFYDIVFISKSLVSAEKKSKVSITNYLGEIFLIYFLIFGIWNIQNRINRLFEKHIMSLEMNNITPSTNNT